ncbi:hypothetical protein OS493_035160 [Desmophyllum pertusum]|uniref:Uncharacterized protein n=1 Tax=Desmophyllum pertusum TaxID=174260 RepID=A0A9W9YLT7_9CNID|nr:hypothetical protein OS493_035160 [Desmophyllum pertusum]
MESKAEPATEIKAPAEELYDDTEVLFPMENLSLTDTSSQTPVATSTPFQLCQRGLEKETPESAFSSQLDKLYDDTWNMTENISTSRIADAPNSLEHLNTFLESREISPISSSPELSSFAIPMLKEICNYFAIDTSHIKMRRRMPYVDLLVAFSKNCSCRK